MKLKDMILNFVGWYDFECYWKIWFWIELKDMIKNFIKMNCIKYIQDWYQVYHLLIKVWWFRCLLFQRLNIMLFYKLYYIKISLKDMILNFIKDTILNFIKRYDFEFHWIIWFWILLKNMILNVIERHDFEFHWKIWF